MTRKNLITAIVFIVSLFVLASLPVFISFLLKLSNPAEYGLLQGNKYDLEFTFKEIMFFVTIIFSLFIISTAVKFIKNVLMRRILSSVSALYLGLSLLFILTDILHFIIFAHPLTFSAIQAIITSDIEESKDFIKIYASKGVTVSILLAIAFLVFLLVKRAWLINLFKSKTFFISTLLVTVFGIIDLEILNYQEDGRLNKIRYWDITLAHYQEYKAFAERMKSEKHAANLSGDYNEFYPADTIPKTIVLVISESLSRSHMSLYGYGRKTTPFLDQRTDIMKLNDCITSGALTSDAVPALFYMDQQKKDVNLISLLNKLGFETWWISNQAGWGNRDGAIILLSQLCNNTVFIDKLASDDQVNTSLHLDEEIIDDFEKALDQNPGRSKFIVLHLIGCHFDYEKRYPKERAFFKGKTPLQIAVNTSKAHEIINNYDNAVLYHDSVVNCLLNTFRNYSIEKNERSALVFLSDHGEELYDNRNFIGHGYPPSKQSADIPFFISLSDAFKENYREIDSVFKVRVNTPYSTRNNFYSTLELLNIHSAKFQDKILKSSIFSAEYDSTVIRHVNGVDYEELKVRGY